MPILDGGAAVATSTKIVVSNPNQPVIGRTNRVVIDVSMPGPPGPPGVPGTASLTTSTREGLPVGTTGDTRLLTNDHQGPIIKQPTGWVSVGEERIDVLNAGLLGDGTNESTRLTNLLPRAVGRKLVFPPRPYRFDTKVTVTQRGVAFEGTKGDFGLATVFQTPNNIDILEFAAGSPGSSVRDIGFWYVGGSAATAGSGIVVAASLASLNGTGSTPLSFEGVSFLGLFDGFKKLGGNEVHLIRPRFGGIVRDAILHGGGLELYLQRAEIYGPGRYGLNIEGSAVATYVAGTQIFQAGSHGMRDAGAGQTFADRVISDGAGGDAFRIEGNGVIRDYLGCWAADAAGYGLRINQTGGGGLKWRGGQIRYNRKSGALIEGSGKDDTIQDAQIGSNGRDATAGDTYGVKVAAGRSNWGVVNNDLGQIANDAPGIAQTHGVFVAAGASDNYRIQGNRDTGNTVQLISDGGTGNNKWVEGTPWITPAFASPTKYANFGSGFQPFQYRRLGHKLQFRGVIACTGAANEPIVQFPLGFRPPNIASVAVWPASQILFVDTAGILYPPLAPGTDNIHIPFTEIDLIA